MDKDKLEEVKNSNRCFFFEPYKWQGDKLLGKMSRYNTTVVVASNKIGKSAVGVNIVISWALGYEPWSRVSKDYVNAVCCNGVYYKPSSLGIKPPVDIVIVG